jgi:hypothetical protein
MASVFEAMETSMWLIGGVTERVQTDNAACFSIHGRSKLLVEDVPKVVGNQLSFT